MARDHQQEVGLLVMHTLHTQEDVDARDQEIARREDARTRHAREAREEEARDREQELLLSGLPGEKEKQIQDELRVLNNLGRGAWKERSLEVLPWSQAGAALTAEISEAAGAAVEAVLRPKIDRAMEALEAARAERQPRFVGSAAG